MGLTLVLVHWEQPERCIRAGRAFLDQGVPLRLLVVDNDSRAEAVAAIAAGLPEAEILPAGRNAGFGGGANVGLRHWLAAGDGEWVAVAPHDALPAPGCLRLLLDAVADRPRAGLASAEYGTVAGRPVVDRYFGGILRPSNRPPGATGWEAAGHPHGTLLLARRSCLEEVGLFDERYFAYCEEADLGERARRAGWEVGLVWGAIVANPSQDGGNPVVDYLMLRNSLLLVRHHFGRYPAAVRLVMALWSTAVLAARPRRRPYHFDLRARRLALGDFVAGRFGPPPGKLRP